MGIETAPKRKKGRAKGLAGRDTSGQAKFVAGPFGVAARLKVTLSLFSAQSHCCNTTGANAPPLPLASGDLSKRSRKTGMSWSPPFPICLGTSSNEAPCRNGGMPRATPPRAGRSNRPASRPRQIWLL